MFQAGGRVWLRNFGILAFADLHAQNPIYHTIGKGNHKRNNMPPLIITVGIKIAIAVILPYSAGRFGCAFCFLHCSLS